MNNYFARKYNCPKATDSSGRCEEEDCQECCEHDYDDHCCLNCGAERDIGFEIDCAGWALEDR